MTKVIIISDSTLDSYYEQTLEYIGEKYHKHPTFLKEGSGKDAPFNEVGSNVNIPKWMTNPGRQVG